MVNVRRAANYVWWNMSYGVNSGYAVTYLYWKYWPETPAGYPPYLEDTSHGALTVKFATTLRRSGIENPFNNETRLQYLADTFTYSIMRDSTSMYWRMHDAASGAVPDDQAYICADWLSLTPYDRAHGTTIYAWCDNIMNAAGLDRKTYLPVFANFYRYR